MFRSYDSNAQTQYWSKIEGVLRKLFPEEDILIDNEREFYEGSFDERILENGDQRYELKEISHGPDQRAFFIVLHMEKTDITRDTDTWPRKLSSPNERDVSIFVDFLESKGIRNAREDYGQYQCVSRSW